jgi:putative FmdB family regulatory protein
MPIYEYECKSCGQLSEELQKFSDPPLKKCRECGGKVIKVMSMNTFHLKGSGWYVTDYAGKKSTTSTKTDSVCSAAGSETSPKKDTVKETAAKTE